MERCIGTEGRRKRGMWMEGEMERYIGGGEMVKWKDRVEGRE